MIATVGIEATLENVVSAAVGRNVLLTEGASELAVQVAGGDVTDPPRLSDGAMDANVARAGTEVVVTAMLIPGARLAAVNAAAGATTVVLTAVMICGATLE